MKGSVRLDSWGLQRGSKGEDSLVLRTQFIPWEIPSVPVFVTDFRSDLKMGINTAGKILTLIADLSDPRHR